MTNKLSLIFFGLIRTIHPTITRRFLYGYIYNFTCKHFRINEKSVLLESHHGKDFGGNPYYLAACLTSSPKYKHLRLIMVGPRKRAQWLKKRLKSKNIISIKPGSLLYIYYLATSKWLISDVTFPLYFSLRSEQRYLNTWHGTPLKVLGRHIPGGLKNQLLNTQRNFLHASDILIPNKHTEEVLLDSYFLKIRNNINILHFGYPRNDTLFSSQKKIIPKNNLHIAFMPTWRGEMSNRASASQQQIQKLTSLLDNLNKLLPISATLWVKLHPLVSGKINLHHYKKINSFPVDIETYEHLATCDALITDYSSVFFDFSTTRRPIIRYIPDEEGYETERGFCLDPDTLPFPCVRTPKELVALIQNLIDGLEIIPSSEYKKFLETYNNLDHGSSAREVCDAFFSDTPRFSSYPQAVLQTKKSVGLYIGRPTLHPDAYSSMFKMLDTERHAITLIIEIDAITPEWNFTLKNLNPAIMYIPIQFHAYITPMEFLEIAWKNPKKHLNDTVNRTWRKVGSREYRRLFGEILFDDFITLDGQSVGSKLLEFSHDWKNCISLSTDEIAQGKIAKNLYLKEYFYNDF